MNIHTCSKISILVVNSVQSKDLHGSFTMGYAHTKKFMP